MAITKEEFANQINGADYPYDLTPPQQLAAKESNLVVIYGESDDLCEIRGAISDELPAYGSREFSITKSGQLLEEIDRSDAFVLRKYGVLEVAQQAVRAACKVRLKWSDGPGPAWTVETAAPHATFLIMEDGAPFSQGIVIDLKDLLEVA